MQDNGICLLIQRIPGKNCDIKHNLPIVSSVIISRLNTQMVTVFNLYRIPTMNVIRTDVNFLVAYVNLTHF